MRAVRWAVAVAVLVSLGGMGAAPAEEPFSFAATPGKLPKGVVPHRYRVELAPDPAALSTAGTETVELEVTGPTDRLVLNAVDASLSEVSLKDGQGVEHRLTASVDEKAQTVELRCDPAATIAPGPYTLSFQFRSAISKQPHGLFVQPVRNLDGSWSPLLATQMETTDARRMFPCWDEPSFRASFELAVETDGANTAVSNMPIVSETATTTGRKRVSFAPTPPMASYLVVLACGRLEWVEDEIAGVKLRVLTSPGKKELGRYALEVTKQVLPYYNDYFGTAYPLPKLDQIALPSGFGGAMENWGGITYNEDVVLFDPQASSEETRRNIFLTMAHEIAHQWFGDLVTMAWWDNLWLNEGFASWMELKATDHFHPEWKVWLHDIEEKQSAMARDSRATTHPIQQPVATEAEADAAFDEITYQKGEAFIRMLEDYLGPEPFRDGIRTYLTANAYRNTTTANLWDALQRTTGKPVREVAPGWTEQPGFPVVRVLSGDNGALTLEQRRFLIGDRDVADERWAVPVGLLSGTATNRPRYVLLKEGAASVPGPEGVDTWVKANAGGVGYFRVEYDSVTFGRLRRAVPELPEADRVNLLSDVWAAVLAGDRGAPDFFGLLETFRDDDSPAVWETVLDRNRAVGALGFIDRLEHGTPGQENYERFVCSLFRPKLAKLGWDEKPGEAGETRSWRGTVIQTLGYYGDPAVVDESLRRFDRFFDDPAALAPDLRPAVTMTVGRHANPETYAKLEGLLDRANTAEDRRMYLRALAAVEDPQLAARTLATLMSEKVPAGDAGRMLRLLAFRGQHGQLVWQYAQAHLPEMERKFGFFRWNSLLPAIGQTFTDPVQADELLAFTKSRLPPTALREAEDSANLIRLQAAFKTQTLPALDRWLAEAAARRAPAAGSG